MDPSKFSVRVTNPTMIRQERFSDSSGLNNSEIKQEFIRPSVNSNKYKKTSTSWCAPRKVQPAISSASIKEDSSENELGTKTSAKNLKNVRRWIRASQHVRRIEELSRPRVVVRRLPRSQEAQSKICTKLLNDPETTSLQIEVTPKPPITAEKQIRHRQPTDRISKLAEPKVHESLAFNLLGKVEERALFAVASKRISELATPKNLSTQDSMTEKRDPFGVRPQALKATCTPRIELLARPKKISLFSPNKQFTSETATGIGVLE